MKDVMFTLLLLFISHVAPIVSASGGIPSEAATWDEKMSPVKKKKKNSGRNLNLLVNFPPPLRKEGRSG